MEVIKTAIEGVVIIEPKVFKDARGYFLNLSLRESSKIKFARLTLCRIMKVCLLME